MMKTRTLLGPMAAIALAFSFTAPSEVSAQEVRNVQWGTSAVGSSGHRALVTMAATLNRIMDDVNITVLPMPGAIMTVKGHALGEIDGYYGSDVAFAELAQGTERFEGFRDAMQREPLQSFWSFTMETGVAIRADDRDEITEWRDLSGRSVFTGPRPWDTRMNLERTLAPLAVEHDYVEIDLGIAGSQLQAGAIDAFLIYTAGESDIAPWIAEAELVADIAVLNPSAEEQEMLREAGFDLVSVSPDAFETDVHVEEIVFAQLFYGFHLGADFSEDEIYRMLLAIEEHAEELAQADPAFTQIAEDMADIQRRGVNSSVDDVMIHPGLARYMRERGVWNDAWNDRVADVEAG